MKTFKLFIPIEPVPKARPRLGKAGNTYTPKKTSDYERKLKSFFEEAWKKDTPPMEGPIMAEVWFYVTRPKSVPKKRRYPDTKPDLDNFEKAVFDALDFYYSDKNRKIAKENRKIEAINEGLPKDSKKMLIPKVENGRIIDNDSRIVSKITHKRFYDTAGKTGPGIEILLKEMDPDNDNRGKENPDGVQTPLAVIFSGEYSIKQQQAVAQGLLKKNYCPLFLDTGEHPQKITRYTAEILKLADALCILDNSKSKENLNTKLEKTIQLAERFDKEIFRLKL